MAEQADSMYARWIPYFYRIFPWFSLVQSALVAVVLWQVMHPYQPPFYAVTPEGDQISLQAHDDPSMLPGVLLRWSGMAAVAAYTFDFVSYKKQTEDARQWFTPTGWEDYQRSLTELLKTITQRQIFVSSVVSAPPVIAKSDESSWDIQLPFMVTYQGSENSTRKAFLVRMKVVRVPAEHNPSGLGVDEFIMGGAKAS